MKTVWIDERSRLISFSLLSGAEVYHAEETEFWQRILSLMYAGYRVQ